MPDLPTARFILRAECHFWSGPMWFIGGPMNSLRWTSDRGAAKRMTKANAQRARYSERARTPLATYYVEEVGDA